MIAPPLLQLFVFSFAATLEVRNVDIAIVNDDQGRASHELIERIAAASFIDEVIVVDRQDAITQLLDRASVLAGLHFAADFSRDVAAQRPASVQVIIDGRRANAGQIAMSYIDRSRATTAPNCGAARSAGMPHTRDTALVQRESDVSRGSSSRR